MDFLERLLEEMPFPIQRIQSDRGLEFFAEKVQRRLMEWAIKFRPIKATVAASQRQGRAIAAGRPGGVLADRRSKIARPSTTARRMAALLELGAAAQRALGGKTPIDRICELLAISRPLNR